MSSEIKRKASNNFGGAVMKREQPSLRH